MDEADASNPDPIESSSACFNYYTPRIEELIDNAWVWNDVVYEPGNPENYRCGYSPR